MAEFDVKGPTVTDYAENNMGFIPDWLHNPVSNSGEFAAIASQAEKTKP